MGESRTYRFAEENVPDIFPLGNYVSDNIRGPDGKIYRVGKSSADTFSRFAQATGMNSGYFQNELASRWLRRRVDVKNLMVPDDTEGLKPEPVKSCIYPEDQDQGPEQLPLF